MTLVWNTSTEMRLFLTTGILGAFTTFSAFSLDFAVLYERRAFALCALYTTALFVLSVSALFVGLHFVRRLVAPPL
jgi:CrcB protein